MKKLSKILYFFITLSFAIYVNFYFSNCIIQKLSRGWNYSDSFLKITYAENTGAAFSIFQNSTNYLIVLATIAIMGIIYFCIRHLSSIRMKSLFFLAILSAGILGNLYQRVVLGYVIDYFKLTFINFPIFNISDIFINIGVIGIIILILFTKKPIKLL